MNDLKLLRRMHAGEFTYLLYEETYMDRRAYSIAICNGCGEYAYANDITHEKEAAERFFHLISEGGLAPCHLYDVLEDMLPLT